MARRGAPSWRLLLLTINITLLLYHGPAAAAEEDGNHGNAAALQEERVCHLHPFDPSTKGLIARHQKQGQMLRVKLTLWDAAKRDSDDDDDDEEDDDGDVFGEWYVTRPRDNFGAMTLTLLQELPAMSRTAMPFFSELLDMRVVDTPAACMRVANHSTRMRAARDLLLGDVSVHQPREGACLELEHSVCHVTDISAPRWWRYPAYGVECCAAAPPGVAPPGGVAPPDGGVVCRLEEGSALVEWMRRLMCLAKLCCYLVAPALIARAFSRHTDHVTCEVLLPTPIHKTLLVKSTKVPHVEKDDRKGALHEPFSRLRESIKSVTSGRILGMSITKVSVSADRARLVGVSSFVSDVLGACTTTPTAESAPTGGEEDEGRGRCCRLRLAVVAGGTLALALLSVPFYIRVVALCRLDAHLEAGTSGAGDAEYEGSWAWLVLVGTHACFVLTGLLLVAAGRADPKVTDTVFYGAFRDLRAVSLRAILRMLCDNMKLPFKKFGRYGIVVAVLYWIVSLPVCLLVGLVYAVPSVYTFGRFLFYFRPRFLRKKMTVLTSRDAEMACCCRASTGTTLERYLQLGRISPGGEGHGGVLAGAHAGGERLGCIRGALALLLAVVCMTNLACLLVMLGEIVALAGETLIYTTFYVFAHADRMLGYVVLFPGLGVYVCWLYQAERAAYTRYKAQLFSVLDGLVEAAVHDHQPRGGYEGVTLAGLGETDAAFYLPDTVLRECLGQDAGPAPSNQFLGRVDQRLYWCTSGLVYVVGRDRARYLPAGLLERIGSLHGPGYNPRRLLTRRLVHLVALLGYTALASLVFAYVTELDGARGASHVVLAIAFYGLPLAAFHAAGSRRPHIDLLTLKRGVCMAAQGHVERWLVCDLAFPAPKPQSPTDTSATTGGIGNPGAQPPEGATSSPPGTNNCSFEEAPEARPRDARPGESRPSYVDFVFCVGVDEEERLDDARGQDGLQGNRDEFVMLPV